jgi:transcriptional regulator with XRE-family HTH domain
MMEEPMIGPLLRELRERAGRSQADQAAILSDLAGVEKAVTRNQVSRWENEKRIVTPYWQKYCAASFGVPVKDLGRAVAASRARRRREKQQAERDGEEKVLRREFIGTSLAMAGLAVGALQLAANGQLGVSDIRQLEARTARLRRLDEFLGGADTYRLYVAEVESTAALMKRATLTPNRSNRPDGQRSTPACTTRRRTSIRAVSKPPTRRGTRHSPAPRSRISATSRSAEESRAPKRQPKRAASRVTTRPRGYEPFSSNVSRGHMPWQATRAR